ncbi:extracellular solute-binding protein [Priestia flexa]|uniref:extracellular solute-binding protein n=1 Tax=Priestia flexa TaxID=86664 RepID=UPI000955EC54|nr:extracellular solute-binding protein [Priestia flexa]WHX80480.1 extracellular solute-binding protein [Priestia flexa]SIR49634.1 extracellular solute-binding protein [Priestia flexa]
MKIKKIIAALPHDQIGQLALEGVIAPVTVESSIVSAFTEQSIRAESYAGKLYGLPKAIETPIFLYNKDLMKKAPKTMNELYEISKSNQNAGQYGFLAPWDNFYFANAVLSGMGSYVFKQEKQSLDPTDIGLHSDGAIDGGSYISKWYNENLFPKAIIGENGGSTLEALFQKGKWRYYFNACMV